MNDAYPVDRRTLMGAAAIAWAASATASQRLPFGPAPKSVARIALWPDSPPGARSTLPKLARELHGEPGRQEMWITGVAAPVIDVHQAAKSNGIGLLALAGGGYGFLSIQNEGTSVAHRLTELGYTVFVLTYRLPAEGWADQSDVPLQDAQRAMRLIRTNAARFGIDPARAGVIGFSAGGHLAASLATAYGEQVYQPVDAADRQDARPAFAGLFYAVTTLEKPVTHAGTRDHLLGTDPSAALVKHRSPVLHVDAKTPASFVLHALDDPVVPPECSLIWTSACRTAGVAVETHLPQRGGHGFGISLPSTNPASLWPSLLDLWIQQGFAQGSTTDHR